MQATVSSLAKYQPGVPVTEKTGYRNSAKKIPLTMKNKKHMVALLVGGNASDGWKLRKNLAESRNIYAKYHIESERNSNAGIEFHRPIPSDVDVVLFLVDFLGHDKLLAVINECKKIGVRWIRTMSKWSTMVHALHNHSIHSAEPLDPLHLSRAIWGKDLGDWERPKPTPAPVAIIQPTTPAPATPAPIAPAIVQAPAALTPLVQPALQQVVQTVTASTPTVLTRTIKAPSPRFIAVASALMSLCAEEGVQVLCSACELTITASN